MVVTTYFHKLVARLLLPCDKVVAWLLQPWHFYMGSAEDAHSTSSQNSAVNLKYVGTLAVKLARGSMFGDSHDEMYHHGRARSAQSSNR